MNDKLDDKDKNIFLFINRNNNVYACLDMKSPCLSNNDLKGKIPLNLPFRGDYKISKYIHDNLKEAGKKQKISLIPLQNLQPIKLSYRLFLLLTLIEYIE